MIETSHDSNVTVPPGVTTGPNVTTTESHGHAAGDGDDHDIGTHQPTVILFIFASCAAGALVRTSLKRVPLPYTVVLMILGVLLGLISTYVEAVKAYTTIASADPHVILHVFMPVLIFESAFAMETHTFIKTIWQVVILALPGLAVSATLTAVFSMQVFSYNWDWPTALMFGSILSATDPVAVVALLKELGASKQLATTMEGESLLNDGAAIVFFNVFLAIASAGSSVPIDGGAMILTFVQVAVGGPAFGFLVGKLTVLWLVNVFNDALTEITITLAATYVTFYVGESLFGVSGVLAVVVLGLVLSAERTSISPEVEAFLHRFWEMLAYLANTLIFIVCGVVITQRATIGMSGSDWFYMIALYCAIVIIRGLTIAAFSPIMSRIGYGLKWQNATVMTWGGLRGAVGLAMALLVAQYPGIDPNNVGNKILFHTAGIVLMTLLLNATSVKYLLKVLGMSDISGPKRMAMATAVRTLKDWADVSLHLLMTDRFLADADWEVVKKFTEIEDPYHTSQEEAELDNLTAVYERTSLCPSCETSVPNEPSKREMQEMRNEARLRMIKAQKTSYWKQFEHGMLARESVRKLVECAEIATDQEDGFISLDEIKKTWEVRGMYAKLKQRLEAWKYNRNEVRIPMPTYRGLQMAYRICSTDWFEGLLYTMILLNMIPVIWELVLEYQYPEDMTPTMKTIVFPTLNYIFILIYLIEAGMKAAAFRRWYIKDHWNQFDLVIIFLSLVDVVLDWTLFQTGQDLYISPSILRIGKGFRLIRLIRSLRLVKGLIPQMITWVNGRINIQLRFGYDVGMGYVMGEEEVLKLIDHMVDNTKIASQLKMILEDGRLEIIRALGLLARIQPGIAVSVKTQQAARRVLNNVRDKISELRGEGVLDETEAGKLGAMVETRMKRLLSMPALIPPPPPERVVGNLTWVADDEDLIAYIKHHSELLSLAPGEIIMKMGDPPGGIYIIVSGLVRVCSVTEVAKTIKFAPVQKETKIKDADNEKKETETYCDYLTTGNVIGEMGLLTNRPRSSTCMCETAVQAYYIMLEAMRTALELYTDEPSLEYRLWRVCAVRIASGVLLKHPNYFGWSQDKVRMHLENCLTFDLSKQDEFEIDPKLMSDLVLVNGSVRLFNTRETYKGPAYIPCNVDKIIPVLDKKQKPILVVVLRDGTTERRGSTIHLRRKSMIDPKRSSMMCLRHASKQRLELEKKISEASTGKPAIKKRSKPSMFNKILPMPAPSEAVPSFQGLSQE